MVNLNKRERKLSRVQMYQRQYYRVKWANICEEKWKEYDKTTSEGPEKMTRLNYINFLCGQFLEEESDEVKKEIDVLLERQLSGEEFLLLPEGDEDSDDEDFGNTAAKRRAIEATLTQWNK